MIILTAPQAAAVRGETSAGAALDPVALADGVTFVLPEKVLSDPAHAARHALLAALPAAAWAEAGLRTDYLCKGRFDASAVTAFFFNGTPSAVVLLEGEGATRLPRAVSASGARYSDGEQSFWVKGDRASWQQGQAPARSCEPRPR
jgi:membrane-bound inhibitor of C-type lysozyme